MTDNELNAMVAEKVMGQHRVGDCPLGDSSCVGKYEPMVNGRPCLPDYANDIAAAWQVVDKLRIAVRPSPDAGKWYAGQLIQLDDGVGTWIAANWATATTAPRAICLAALDAMGVRVAVRPGVSMTWDISEKDHDELRSMFGV